MVKRPFRLIVGITGATGTIMGVRLLQVLKEHNVETHLILSNWGARTLVHETPYPWLACRKWPRNVTALKIRLPPSPAVLS